ncbi:MAG: hypothetical protein ACK5MJ_07375 [Alphaproteobacteria bacterium]
MSLELLLKPFTFLDPTVAIVALICSLYTRKFIYIWPIVIIFANILPIAIIIINRQYFEIFHNQNLQEIFKEVAIIRLVIGSLWALLCWWGTNRMRDYLKK